MNITGGIVDAYNLDCDACQDGKVIDYAKTCPNVEISFAESRRRRLLQVDIEIKAKINSKKKIASEIKNKSTDILKASLSKSLPADSIKSVAKPLENCPKGRGWQTIGGLKVYTMSVNLF